MTVGKIFAAGRPALIGYLPAGFPTVEGGIEAITAVVDAGVDAVEVGFPYSDPVIDGPVIQRATEAALAAGVRPADVLRTVERVAALGVPAVVMTYWNPMERYGVARFARDLAAAGGAGLITPDLIPDEAGEWIAASDEHGLDRIFLVSPSSTEARVRSTTAACRGFVYATALMGVTGARDQVSSSAGEMVRRIRPHTALPIALGFGVSRPEHVAEIGVYADAAVVGSALVSVIAKESATTELIPRVEEYVRWLKSYAHA